jgi:hypothetical protein
MSGDGFGPDGIHEADRWMLEHADDQALNGDGVCFAVLNGEQLGPFRCKADAEAALDRKLAGTELLPGADAGSVIFADPAVYHVPPTGQHPNG